MKTVARLMCESRKFDIGEGRCALICLEELGSPRDKPHGCPHAEEVFCKMIMGETG